MHLWLAQWIISFDESFSIIFLPALIPQSIQFGTALSLVIPKSQWMGLVEHWKAVYTVMMSSQKRLLSITLKSLPITLTNNKGSQFSVYVEWRDNKRTVRCQGSSKDSRNALKYAGLELTYRDLQDIFFICHGTVFPNDIENHDIYETHFSCLSVVV